jgi:hypothetical protein
MIMGPARAEKLGHSSLLDVPALKERNLLMEDERAHKARRQSARVQSRLILMKERKGVLCSPRGTKKGSGGHFSGNPGVLCSQAREQRIEFVREKGLLCSPGGTKKGSGGQKGQAILS